MNASDPTIESLGKVGKYSVVHLDFTDGVFAPEQRDEAAGPDSFELGIGNFLAISAMTYRMGFPLGDAWIHLTYARNFALHGEWAFRLGEVSAGSTSPFWTALLAIGFLIRLSSYAWTFFLGWVILTLIAMRAETSARKLLPSYKSKLPWVGLFFALAWHLTWTAVSGMETLLHGLIVLIVVGMLMENSRHYLTLGLLAGLSVWVRPDGLTLLGPILFVMYFQEETFKAQLTPANAVNSPLTPGPRAAEVFQGNRGR